MHVSYRTLTKKTDTLCLVCFKLFAIGILATAAFALNHDQLKMLQDPGGWQYLELSDAALGVQTVHTCFDGHPHPDECSGTLTLSPGKTFVQSLRIQGKGYQRHGTYQLEGDQLTLFDELGTRDGPYTVSVDPQHDTMVMQMSPAGGDVRCRFLLNREYHKRMRAQQKSKQD